MNIKSLKLLPAAIVLLAGSAICAALRTMQYFSVLEEHTGFYISLNAEVYAFFAVLLACVLFFLVSSFIARKNYAFDTSAVKRPISGIISLLCGAGVFVSVYGEYAAKDEDTSAYTVSSALSASAGAKVTYVVCVLGLIAAVYFIVMGVSFILGRSGSMYKLLALAPVLWCVVRLVIRFTRTVSYLKVSDLFLEMMALAAYCIFFMAFSRCSSEVNPEGSPKLIVGFGLTGALLGIVCFLPRVIAVVAGQADCIYVLSRADVSDLTIPLFMLSAVFARIIPAGSLIKEDGSLVKEESAQK